MSGFFVGQRVRIIRCNVIGEKWLVGVETRIVASDDKDWILDISWAIEPSPVRCPFRIAPFFLAPIIPPKEACDEEFKHDLDKLLEGVPA